MFIDSADKRLKQVESKADAYEKELLKQYKQANSAIKAKLNNFYAEYGTLDYMEVRRILSSVQRLDLQKRAKKAYKLSVEQGYSKDFQSYAKDLQNKMRIQRLELLQFQVWQEIERLTAYQRDNMTDNMTNIYTDNYYQSAYDDYTETGIAVQLGGLNTAVVEEAVKGKWLESNYIDRNSANGQRVLQVLNEVIPQAFILGKNPREFAAEISEKLGTSYNNAVRLARTEFIHIATQSRYQQMKDTGLFDMYEYVATLDSRTSEICQAMDNKRFRFSEYKQGVTAPPLHPHCRSTIVPVFDDEEISQRIAKDKSGKYFYVPSNMSYKEYKEKYLT